MQALGVLAVEEVDLEGLLGDVDAGDGASRAGVSGKGSF